LRRRSCRNEPSRSISCGRTSPANTHLFFPDLHREVVWADACCCFGDRCCGPWLLPGGSPISGYSYPVRLRPVFSWWALSRGRDLRSSRLAEANIAKNLPRCQVAGPRLENSRTGGAPTCAAIAYLDSPDPGPEIQGGARECHCIQSSKSAGRTGGMTESRADEVGTRRLAGLAYRQSWQMVEIQLHREPKMDYIAEQDMGLVDRLRFSDQLASQIVQQGQLHADPRDLRRVLNSDGSSVHAVLKNWVFSLIETQPERFQNLEEAERFVTRALTERMLEAFPGRCEL